MECFNDLFDIAHADALMLITIPEDKDFIVAKWQKRQPELMGAMGMVQIHLEQCAQHCLDAEFECFQQSQADISKHGPPT